MNSASPTVIRHAIGQEHYAVTCDRCHGRRYLDGELCSKCEGDGRVLIRERRSGQRGLRELFHRFVGR